MFFTLYISLLLRRYVHFKNYVTYVPIFQARAQKKFFVKKNWTHYMKIGHHRWILKQNTDTAKICKINNFLN